MFAAFRDRPGFLIVEGVAGDMNLVRLLTLSLSWRPVAPLLNSLPTPRRPSRAPSLSATLSARPRRCLCVFLPQEMRTSVFCLAPTGGGWGLRLVEAMQNGCIPLIIQDGVRQPGDGYLPYNDFSVRIAEADLERTEEILRAIPPAKARGADGCRAAPATAAK